MRFIKPRDVECWQTCQGHCVWQRGGEGNALQSRSKEFQRKSVLLERRGMTAKKGTWAWNLGRGGELETGGQSRVLMARPPCSQLSTSHLPLRLRRPEKRQPLVPELNIILGTCSLLALDSLRRAHWAVPRVWEERPRKVCSSLHLQTICWAWEISGRKALLSSSGGPPRGKAGCRGEGWNPIPGRGGAGRRQIPCARPGLFSHIHTPGCLKVTSNQTFTGQELPLCYLEIR